MSHHPHHHSSCLVCIALVLALAHSTTTATSPLRCSSTSHPNDCSALSHIYNSIYYAENASRLPWINGSHVCDRPFVRCDRENYVVELDLHNLGLAGTIPPEISLFVRPQSLYFYANEISGHIPNSLCCLTSLTDVDLSENLLEGHLPNDIGNLTSLTYLGFSYNKLTGTIPSSIGRLSKLRTLKGDYNQIQGTIPSTIGQMSSLVYFVLSYNQLVGSIPREIGQMSHLYDVELHNNYLTELPSEISFCTELTSLSIGFNSMSGPIPSSLPSSLVGLFFENNQFSGHIPTNIYQLRSLQQLELDHNLLEGDIPASLGWMPYLQTMHLNNNQFTGVLPNNFGGANFSNIVSLFLNNNQFEASVSGQSIPASFEQYACSLKNQSSPVQCLLQNNNFTRRDVVDNPCLVKACGLRV